MESTIHGMAGKGTVKAVLLVALLSLIGTLALTDTSRAAETKTIKVDNGRLTMGFVFLNNKIMPADVPGPLDPDITNTSGNGSIDVEIDGSTATVADEDFDMPIVWIPDPTAGGAPIPMKFAPKGGLSGTWDSATGELSLSGTLQVDVIWGFDEGGAKICRFTAPNLTWTTGPNAISPGVPFSNGLTGNGAISAFWGSLPAGESINGGNCAKPNAVVRDPGAVWLSSGIAEVPPAPTCQADGKEGLWPDCTEPEWPDPDPVVKISRITVGKAKVRAGKKTKLRIKVTNTGDLTANRLTVRLKSSNKAVRVPARIRLNVRAGKTATATITVNARRNAKGKATITASTSGKSAKGVVTVKKAKKKKKKVKKRR